MQYSRSNGFWGGTMFPVTNTRQILPPINGGNSSDYTRQINAQLSPDIGNTKMLLLPPTPDKFSVGHGEWLTPQEISKRMSPLVQAPTDILEKKVNQSYGVSQNMQMQHPSANFTRIGGQAISPVNQQNSRKVASKPSLGYDYLRSRF